MKIDLYYFDGCPSWQPGLENLRSALALEEARAEINLVNIRSDEDAQRLRFLGSPSFVVDGEDLWPESREEYHLSCRIYMTPAGFRGAPTVEMLRGKLATHLHKTQLA
jgi:hypothetical protein